MEKRATTAVTSQKATENQVLLVSEPLAECPHSNARGKDTTVKNPFCSRIGTIYVFPTQLGRCTILGTCRMVCFLQKRKGTVTLIFLLLQQSNLGDAYTMVVQHMPSVLDKVSDRVTSWLRCSNNHG